MDRLAGKAAVVTGAASGIGRASAELFAAEGARVVAVDVVDAVEDTVAAIRKAGGTAIAQKADAGNEDDVKAGVDLCMKEFGRIDAYFANAGISGGLVAMPDVTPEHFMEVIRVNLLGPFLAVKHASPHMKAQGGGSIIGTASVAGLRASAGGIPYSASKAGLVNMVRVLANALYGTGVRVNAICPGLIETGMTKPIFDFVREKGIADRLGSLNPMKRYGHPIEIANAALFLASDEASYVNGEALVVDGGLNSTHPFVPR